MLFLRQELIHSVLLGLHLLTLESKGINYVNFSDLSFSTSIFIFLHFSNSVDTIGLISHLFSLKGIPSKNKREKDKGKEEQREMPW